MDNKKAGGGGDLTCFKSSTIVGTEKLIEAKGVRIYPVPAKEKITIEVEDQLERTEIYDLSSKLISTNRDEKIIDVSGLKPGTYIIKVFTPKSTSMHKFIKL